MPPTMEGETLNQTKTLTRSKPGKSVSNTDSGRGCIRIDLIGSSQTSFKVATYLSNSDKLCHYKSDMGDEAKSTSLGKDNSFVKPPISEENVEVEDILLAPYNQPPPYRPNQPPPQNYYYDDPSYNRRTPAYQQEVGGQYVYVSGGTGQIPLNASRAPAYRQNQPIQQDSYEVYRDEEIFGNSFDSVKIRNQFVQKVYTILAVQLTFNFLFMLLVHFEISVRRFFIQNSLVLLIIAMIVYFSVSIALLCCLELRRSFPMNFVLLGVLTMAMTVLTSILVAVVATNVVLAAMATTAAVCFLVSVFACQTKYDITGCGMCLCLATLVLMLYGLVLTILTLVGINIPILHIIYSGIGVLLFCLWLMYDTQMIVGGRRIELSPEEYIVGALTLYCDIMIIFTHILTLYQFCLEH